MCVLQCLLNSSMLTFHYLFLSVCYGQEVGYQDFTGMYLL